MASSKPSACSETCNIRIELTGVIYNKKITDLNRNEQFKKFFENEKISQKEFASRLDSTQQYVSALLNGKRKVGSNIVERLEKEFDMNIGWFVSGEGSMKKNTEVGKIHALDEDPANYKFEDDDVFTLRQDIKAVNENLLKLSEGVTVNFERVGGALFEALKGQQKILKFIEQIDADRINKATGKLDEFLESR